MCQDWAVSCGLFGHESPWFAIFTCKFLFSNATGPGLHCHGPLRILGPSWMELGWFKSWPPAFGGATPLGSTQHHHIRTAVQLTIMTSPGQSPKCTGPGPPRALSLTQGGFFNCKDQGYAPSLPVGFGPRPLYKWGARESQAFSGAQWAGNTSWEPRAPRLRAFCKPQFLI